MGILSGHKYATLYVLIPLIWMFGIFTIYKKESFISHAIASGYERHKLQHCDCFRDYKSANLSEFVHFNETTCGWDAYRRGPHQKVVGFSFYGNVNTDYSKKKGYFMGIADNLKLMPRFYPGWVMRLYFDLDPTDPILEDLCGLACANPIIDLCQAGTLPGTPFENATQVFPMNWRFFPTLDPQVRVH